MTSLLISWAAWGLVSSPLILRRVPYSFAGRVCLLEANSTCCSQQDGKWKQIKEHWRCCVAGKVTVGLASYWRCRTTQAWYIRLLVPGGREMSDNCWRCYRLHYPRRPAQCCHQRQAGTERSGGTLAVTVLYGTLTIRLVTRVMWCTNSWARCHWFWFCGVLLHPHTESEYCDERVCLSMIISSELTTRLIFTKIVVPVTYGRGSVLWRRTSPKWPILCRVGR